MNLVAELDRAGLTGRGGAGFPTAVKLRAAHERGATLVVNACDGEVGATKDAWIVEHYLDELVRGADLVGGAGGVVYAAHRGSPTVTRLAARGLTVLDVPVRYVSSEASALVSLLHTGIAKPLTKRVPLVYGGRDSRGRRIPPTLVLNAETVWRIAQIAEYGADWFASIGTRDAPGPRLVAVGGHVASPGVVHTSSGTALPDILAVAGGPLPGAAHVLVGGLAGVLLTADEAARAVWSPADMARFGGGLGPGVVEVFDPLSCPLSVVGDLIGYGAGESAGQCGPCFFGLPTVAQAWSDLVARPGADTHHALRAHLGLLPGRGACGHPDGMARFVASALRTLEPHLAQHAAGHCSSRRSHVLASS